MLSPSPALPGPSASAPTPPSRRSTSTPGSISLSPRRSSRSAPQSADQAQRRRLVTHVRRAPSRNPAGQCRNPRTRRSPQLRNAGVRTAANASSLPSALLPTASRSIQPPREYQPDQPPLGVVCQLCHRALSEPVTNASSRRSALLPTASASIQPPSEYQPAQPPFGAVCH